MSNTSLNEWKKSVRVEYDKIQHKNSKELRNETRFAWSKNKQITAELLNQELSLLAEQKNINWNPEVTVKVPRKACVKTYNFIDSTKIQDKIPIQMLNDITPLPRMKMWNFVKKNVTDKEENEFRNIPYLGDSTDSEFEEIIEKSAVKQNESSIGDDLLIELVNSLPKHGDNEAKIVFDAIAKEISQSGSAEELQKRFRSLTKTDEVFQNYAADIDGPQADSLAREQTLNSYKDLFCRRCLKYDCDLHIFKVDQPKTSGLQQRRGAELKPPSQPCGSKCYMLLDKKLGRNKFKQGSTSNSSKDFSLVDYFSSSNEDCFWTGSDQSLYRSIAKIFLTNYCAISRTMLNKTCQQVYHFAQYEGTTGSFKPECEVKTEAAPKDKYRIFSNHCISIQLKTDPTLENVFPYTPCNHSGPCDKNCSCVKSQNFCEKFCNCSLDCPIRFPGCKCKAQCIRKNCACYLGQRECDPDLCKTCGSDNYEVSQMTCKNVNIQRGLSKHLLLAPSDVAGWGIFLKNSVEKNEFISEYLGEIISQHEANRRGQIYDKNKCSYLFDLNNDFVIDATNFGSKIRFANYSNTPNCYATVMMVNGDHRIGIFAKDFIPAGEELFFDYNYSPTEKLNFLNAKKK